MRCRVSTSGFADLAAGFRDRRLTVSGYPGGLLRSAQPRGAPSLPFSLTGGLPLCIHAQKVSQCAEFYRTPNTESPAALTRATPVMALWSALCSHLANLGPVLVEFTGMFSCRGSYHSRCRGYFMDSGTFCDAEALSLSVAA